MQIHLYEWGHCWSIQYYLAKNVAYVILISQTTQCHQEIILGRADSHEETHSETKGYIKTNVTFKFILIKDIL